MKLLDVFSPCKSEVTALQAFIDTHIPFILHVAANHLDMNLYSVSTELKLIDSLRPSQTDRENLLGYIPATIRLVIFFKKVSIPQVRTYNYDLATYDYDFSNCGIVRVHKINSLCVKGLGTLILSLLEAYFCSLYRRYIVCSLNHTQIKFGAETFLKKHGYEVLSEFKGANSGNMCKLLAKNITETNRIKPWKPKNEPTDS